MIVYKPRLPRYCETLRSPEGNIERTIGQEKYSFGVFKYSRKPIKGIKVPIILIIYKNQVVTISNLFERQHK